MDLFTPTTFGIFVKLLIAARKIGTEDDGLNRAKALADLMENAGKLNAVVKALGLSGFAADMEKVAKDADAAHSRNPNLNDARNIFAQALPHAVLDPALVAGDGLKARATTNEMIARVKTGLKGNFTEVAFYEIYFDAVTFAVLKPMFDDPAYTQKIEPHLWRRTFGQLDRIEEYVLRLDERIEVLTVQIAKMKEANEARAVGVSEKALFRLVRPIAEDVEDVQSAMVELTRAVEIAVSVQREGKAGSNLGDFVDEVLRRAAELSADGEYDTVAAEIDAALEREEAETKARTLRLLESGIETDLLRRDAASAANRIARKVALDTAPDALFGALLAEQDAWYERGRDKGLNLDLEVSIHLARLSRDAARDPDQRGAALNNLGNALRTLGERETGTARLKEAVKAVQAALKEITRDHVPWEWARTQLNLGNALFSLGGRETDTKDLKAAIDAYEAALKEWTRDRSRLDWAKAKMGLANALASLGERETGTARLEQAVTAYRAALEEQTRDRVPLQWAMTQMNLGNALWMLGVRETGTTRLEQAVAAYRAALEERNRDRVPLTWASTQHNLGMALRTIGERETGTARLKDAVDAFRAAREERTRDRVPLDWAGTTYVLAYTEALIAERTGDIAAAKAALPKATEARDVLRHGGHEDWAGRADNVIAEIEAIIGRLSGDG